PPGPGGSAPEAPGAGNGAPALATGAGPWYATIVPSTSLRWPTAAGRRWGVALGIVALLSIGLRVPFLSVPLNTDEGGYAYVAYWMGHGLVLYRDLWFDRPQGVFLVYALILRVFGESTEAIRFAGACCNAVTTILVGLLAARLFGRRAGLAAAGVYALA